jgi:hypothetical protein
MTWVVCAFDLQKPCPKKPSYPKPNNSFFDLSDRKVLFIFYYFIKKGKSDVTPFLNLCIKYNKKQFQVETMWNLEPLGSLLWVGWMWLNFITGCRALWNDPFRQFGTTLGAYLVLDEQDWTLYLPWRAHMKSSLRQFGNPGNCILIHKCLRSQKWLFLEL